MNRKRIANALSLSCVENYFLVWLSKHIDIRPLYVDSFIPLREVYYDFIHQGAEYARYHKIKRLQDLSEQFSITSHQRYSHLVQDHDENSLILMQVNQSFIDSSKRVPWREDHFICLVRENEDTFKYFNNYPLSSGELTVSDTGHYFGGTCLVYHYDAMNNDNPFHGRDLDLLNRLNPVDDSLEIQNNLDPRKLRDTIGILRVSRKRLFNWLEYMGEKGMLLIDSPLLECITTLITQLDTLYLRLELSIIRSQPMQNTHYDLFREIEDNEYRMLELIAFRRDNYEKKRNY